MITESFENATLNVLIKKQHYINLLKRVDSVEGAISLCKEQNIDISDIVFEKSDSSSVRAFKELQIIARALNEGWKPNWNDGNEYKYFSWFRYVHSSFVFADVSYGAYHTHAGSGSRLCFKSKELAEYAGRTFINLYKDFMMY
jgi:hypothetical protein